MSQKSEDFLSSHVQMADFLGGVTELIAPDNLKSAVTKADRYDPIHASRQQDSNLWLR